MRFLCPLKYSPITIILLFSLLPACQNQTPKEDDGWYCTLPAPISVLPWDLGKLEKAPDFGWLDKESGVRSLLYKGEPFKGADTSVFAYYASPDTLAHTAGNGAKYPAVVLVHGGGGTAFKEWAQLWAERGYAAIAMDLAGNGAEQQRLPDGGPDQSDEYKFGQIDAPITDQWPYHAVANVILAHSLIRSFTEVDVNRTGVTGISWGGYLTCIVAGVDSRFKAAVPVYGCGFLQFHSAWLSRFAQFTPEQSSKWVELWDPSRYVGGATMPVFFINGTNDFAYWLESYAKTYGLVNGPRNFRITVNMPHSHPDGWAPKEIGLFMDQYLKDGEALAKIEKPIIGGKEITAAFSSVSTPVLAGIHFTNDSADSPDRKWNSMEAKIKKGMIHAPLVPDGTLICFVTLTDSRGAIVSSELLFPDTN